MSKMVSVLIPVFNRREEIVRCVKSVLAQSYRPLEIIVVDDGSSDGTEEVVRSLPGGITLLCSEARCGPAHARNLGLRKANGDYVLFLDSDVVLEDAQVVGEMVRKLEEDPEAGSVGGEIAVYLGNSGEVRGRDLNYFGDSVPVSLPADLGTGPAWKECTYLATCNCMARMADLKRIGGFDPYYVFGGEDADVGYALGALGLKNWVGSRTGVQHYHVKGGRYGNETYRYHATRVRFNLKHFGLRRNVASVLRDLGRVVSFYLLLLPKVAYLGLSGQTVRRENWLGGYYLLWAQASTLLQYGEIRGARSRNFLDDGELSRFVEFRKQQGR